VGRKHHGDVPFERYADDIVCHCKSNAQACELLRALQERFSDCGLTLHPQKTRVVYCRDSRRRVQYPETSFDFLGFSFHARTAQDRKGNLFAGFQPAVSRKALKHINRELRLMRVHRRTEVGFVQLQFEAFVQQPSPNLLGSLSFARPS
jgi:RNA-directed DNA polymerase